MADAYFIIENKNDYVVLSSDVAYENVKNILGYEEEIIQEEGDIKREFRWSNDNDTYSQWTLLNLENLKTITIGKNTKVWIQFRYTIISEEGNLLINNVKLKTELYEIDTAGAIPLAVGLEKGNLNYPLKIRAHTYNPYKQNSAIRLQKDLSFIVNNLYGHEVEYFRATPQARSRDVILQEWTLYNVDDPVSLKVLVPDNQVPDNKFNMMFEGMQFEMPFEIHVDKRYFEYTFGRKAMPQKRDILYMPLTNRVYEINSSQPVRDFMNEILYYKMDLKKYEPKPHVFTTDETKEVLDEYTTGVKEIFGEEITAEEKRITAEQHTTEKSSVADPIREFIDPDVLWREENWENSYTTISEFYYDLADLYVKNMKYDTAIRYKHVEVWPEQQDRSYTAWFQEVPISPIIKTATKITLDVNEATIEFKYPIPKIKESQWIELFENGRDNWSVFGQVTYVNYDPAKLTIKIDIPEYIKTISDAGYPGWENKTTLKGQQIARRNFFHSYNYNLNTGIIIDTFNSKWFRITLNNQEYWIPINAILDYEKTYGLIVNISNKFKQLSVFIYTQNEEKTTTLDLIFKYVSNIDIVEERSSNVKCEIKTSSIKITAIRYLIETIEEEKQSLWLNRNIVRDSNLVLIVDNAIPRMRLPYIGTAK